jgi:hypothetical protein
MVHSATFNISFEHPQFPLLNFTFILYHVKLSWSVISIKSSLAINHTKVLKINNYSTDGGLTLSHAWYIVTYMLKQCGETPLKKQGQAKQVLDSTHYLLLAADLPQILVKGRNT